MSVKVSEIFFIMGVTIFLYLSQLQKLTVACYSFFMKNFDYRCNNIFILVTITKKKTTSAVAVIHLFYFIIFRRRGAFFACVSFTWRVTDLFFAVFLLCYFVGWAFFVGPRNNSPCIRQTLHQTFKCNIKLIERVLNILTNFKCEMKHSHWSNTKRYTRIRVLFFFIPDYSEKDWHTSCVFCTIKFSIYKPTLIQASNLFFSIQPSKLRFSLFVPKSM